MDAAPAFLVECTNTTGQTQSSGDDVWPLLRSAIRLDGQPLVEKASARVGPGLVRPVQPGETWRGLIELWQTEQGTSRTVAFGAMVRAPFLEPMSLGRHMISVRCGSEWSENVVFFIEK